MYLLQKRVIELYLLNATELLKSADWYTGQERRDGGLINPFNAFLQFTPRNIRTNKDQSQTIKTNLSVHVISPNVLPSPGQFGGDIPQPQDHAQLCDKIHNALQGLSAKLSDLSAFSQVAETDQDYMLFSSLNRTGIELMYENKSYNKTIYVYESQMVDRSAICIYDKIKVNLSILTRFWEETQPEP